MDGKIVRNVILNTLGTVCAMVAGLLVMPFLIRQLGAASYGLWSLIGTLVGYFGVLDLGVNAAVGRLVAAYKARGEFERINCLVSTAFALLLGVAALAVLAVLGALPVFFKLFAVPPAQAVDVQHAFLIVGFAFAVQFPAAVFGGVIWGYERFDLSNFVEIPITILRTGLTFALIRPGSGLTEVALIATGTTLAGGAAKVLIVFWLVPTFRMSRSFVNSEMVREIYGFGIWMMLISLTGSLIPQIAPTLVGTRLGLASVTTFMVARQLAGYTKQFTIVATQVVAPYAVANHALGSTDNQLLLFLRGGRFAYALALFFLGGFVGIGAQFIHLWQHGEQSAAYVLLLVLLAGELFPMSQWITYSVIVGSKRHNVLAGLAVVEGVLTLVCALVLVRIYGLVGVAIAVAFSSLLTRGLLQWLWGCKIVQVSPLRYARYVFVPTTFIALFPIVILGVVAQTLTQLSWVPLLLLGAAYALVYSACLAPFLFGWGSFHRLLGEAFKSPTQGCV